MTEQHVVVIGAGFGGINAVRTLAGHAGVRVTLVDRNNYHMFVPLLYQVATAALEAPDITHPIRDFLRRRPRVRFLLGNADRIDRNERTVWVDERPVAYDYLIVATGSRTADLGVPGVDEYAHGLKYLNEAMTIRNRIISACEEAAITDDPDRKRRLLSFVVVGGGPTGVEMAGALAELRRDVIPRVYPEIDRELVRISLVQSSDRLIPMLSESSSAYVERTLTADYGVEVRTGTRISEATPYGVRTKSGEFIETFNVVWAAGVSGGAPAGLPEPGRGGRIETTEYLSLESDPNVFVIGDVNGLMNPATDKPYPQVAPLATQQGETAARNILHAMAGERQVPFRYVDRGTMITVGRQRAVAERGFIRITGFPAWLAWLGVHLIKLVGTRNRLMVLLSWAYTYFTYDYAVRILYQRRNFPAAEGDERDDQDTGAMHTDEGRTAIRPIARS